MRLQIHQGDCIDEMDWIPNRSVQCCVTSPPYFGLRDYGHDGQIGLEDSPDVYVKKMVDVFREVHRVLRDDGVLWLNLGDSYNGYMANQRGTGLETKRQQSRKYIEPGAGLRTGTLKNKDLIGIPWRVAFALQADGWYLRQDIIWHKPNPMPESVTDRCTKAHEYLFMLTKSARYYYDHETIKEPSVMKPQNRSTRRSDHPKGDIGRSAHVRPEGGTSYESRNRRSVWTVATRPYKDAHFATYPPALIEPCILSGSRPGDLVLDPFGGSGTTAEVALKNSRRAVLCELNADYVSLIKRRVEGIDDDL